MECSQMFLSFSPFYFLFFFPSVLLLQASFGITVNVSLQRTSTRCLLTVADTLNSTLDAVC